jgi:hypothetical protein
MTVADVAGLVTACITGGLLVVGLFGLRSLSLAARALKVETDPIIVVQELPLYANVELNHHLMYYVGLPDEPFQIVPNPVEDLYAGLSRTTPVVSLLPNVTLLVRNVGRFAAVGLQLNGMFNCRGTSHAFRLPIDVLANDDMVYVTLVNRTLAEVTFRVFPTGHHQPDGDSEIFTPIGRLALRLKLAAAPGFKSTSLFAWIMRRPVPKARLVYVYSPKTVILRAPGESMLLGG